MNPGSAVGRNGDVEVSVGVEVTRQQVVRRHGDEVRATPGGESGVRVAAICSHHGCASAVRNLISGDEILDAVLVEIRGCER